MFLAPPQARAARAMAVVEASRITETLSDGALAFVLDNLDLLDDHGFDVAAERIGRTVWTRDLSIFDQFMLADGRSRELAQRCVRALSDSELIDGIRREPELARLLLPVRPEVTGLPEFWATASLDDPALAVLVSPDRIDAAIRAMVRTGASRLAGDAVHRLGAVRVLTAVLDHFDTSATEEPNDADAQWLAAAARDGGVVAQVLSGPAVRRWPSLVALTRATWPDLVANDYGEDPWFSALRSLTGDASDGGRQYLAAYTLARALGYRSRNQAELIAFGFDNVYIPALHSRISQEAWRLVEPRLPSSSWRDWDYCHRLREGIVNVFVDRDLAPSIFFRVTSDDGVFEILAETAAQSFRGRRFLRRVRWSIDDTETESLSFRTKVIKRLTQ